MRSRAIAYIDGFNLYNGAIKGTPFRWLNLQSLADDLMGGFLVERVHYFTAIVDDRPDDPSQSQRQQVFLSALATLDRVHVHLGLFRTHKRKMRLVRPTDPANPYALVFRTEEKGSDVNLGAQLVWDAFDLQPDAALIISNDSDLQVPVEMAAKLGVEVVVTNPHLHRGQRASLVGADTRKLTKGRLRRNMLPYEIVVPDGPTIRCPASWVP